MYAYTMYTCTCTYMYNIVYMRMNSKIKVQNLAKYTPPFLLVQVSYEAVCILCSNCGVVALQYNHTPFLMSLGSP